MRAGQKLTISDCVVEGTGRCFANKLPTCVSISLPSELPRPAPGGPSMACCGTKPTGGGGTKQAAPAPKPDASAAAAALSATLSAQAMDLALAGGPLARRLAQCGPPCEFLAAGPRQKGRGPADARDQLGGHRRRRVARARMGREFAVTASLTRPARPLYSSLLVLL
jgi:hypothetical protein